MDKTSPLGVLQKKVQQSFLRLYFPGIELLAVLLFWFVFIKLAENDWRFFYPPWARLSLILERRSLGTWLILGTVFTIWIPPVLRKYFYGVCGVGAWIVNGWVLRQRQWHWDLVILPLLILVLFMLAAVYGRMNQRGKISDPGDKYKLGLFVIVGFSLFLGAGYWQGLGFKSTNESNLLRLFWIVHPESLFLIYLQTLFLFNSTTSPETLGSLRHQAMDRFLNPINWFSPQPWTFEARETPSSDPLSNSKSSPNEESKTERRKLWLEGFGWIIWGQLFIWGTMKLVQFLHLAGAPSSYWLPLRQYFPFLLMVIGTMNFVEGICKMYQLKVRPGTDHLLFCPLPSELWSRGNSYLYDWVYHWIYIPLFRRFRHNGWTLLMTLVFVVFNSVLVHDLIEVGLYTYLLKVQTKPLSWTKEFFAGIGSWILIWLLFFKLSQKLKPFVYKNSFTKSLGIVLTHCLAAYSFAFCFQWVPKMISKSAIPVQGNPSTPAQGSSQELPNKPI